MFNFELFVDNDGHKKVYVAAENASGIEYEYTDAESLGRAIADYVSNYYPDILDNPDYDPSTESGTDDTDYSLSITDIDWDIEPFDDDSSGDLNLPEKVIIPRSALDSYVESDAEWSDVCDACGEYLTDTYGFCLNSYRVQKTVTAEHSKKEIDREKMDVITVAGHVALYIDARIPDDRIPAGLYKSELRGGDDEYYCTLEPRVMVNHSGTVLTKEKIDFGPEGFITLDEDSSPDFSSGAKMTMEEFLGADLSDVV